MIYKDDSIDDLYNQVKFLIAYLNTDKYKEVLNEELTTNEINNIIEGELIKYNKLDLVKKYILFNISHNTLLRHDSNIYYLLIILNNFFLIRNSDESRAATAHS